MAEWYRRKTWDKADEEEFFKKLGRARRDGRAQYLKIQAIELVATKKTELLNVAESLLMKILKEFPDDNFNKSSVLHTLGDICKLNNNFEGAQDYYKQAIDFEKIYPNVQTESYLDYSELIVKIGNTNQYEFVENILLEKIPALLFPVSKYKAYSILAVINHYNGKTDQAKQYAILANENANAETSGLQYHKHLGLVTSKHIYDEIRNICTLSKEWYPCHTQGRNSNNCY